MKGKKILLLVAIILNTMGLCHAQVHSCNNYFANVPAETVFEITQRNGDYAQLICNFPDGSRDILWVDTNKKDYTDELPMGGLSKIVNNTFFYPSLNLDDSHLTIINKSTILSQDAIYQKKKIRNDSPIMGGWVGKKQTALERLKETNNRSNNTTLNQSLNLDDSQRIFLSKMDNDSIIFKDAIYPQKAIRDKIEGVISVNCIVEKDGSLSNINLSGFDEPIFYTESLRLLSLIRLNPFKIADRTFRCTHKMAVQFRIDEENGQKIGRVYIADANSKPLGVLKKVDFDIVNTRTPTRIMDRFGNIDDDTKIWHASISIDIPEDTPDLEKCLCMILFKKDGNSIEKASVKFANTFNGYYRHPEFKGKSTDYISINAQALSFRKGKYYSYGYEINFGIFQSIPIIHNFIYDIESHKLLTLTDLITSKEIEEIQKTMGIDLDNTDIGMNDFFLYIGKNGERIVTIALTQENWERFSPHFQNLLGRKDILPLALDQNDFEEGEAFGIQPSSIKEIIIRRPSLGDTGMTFGEHVEGFYKQIEEHQDLDGFSARLNYIIEKDNTLSHYDLRQKDGDTQLFEKFKNLFKSLQESKALMTSISGAVRTYQSYDLSFESKVFDFVQQMPEYPGGLVAALKWIRENIDFPKSNAKNDSKERIFTSFIVEKDGTLSHIQIAKSTNTSIEQIIKTVLRQMPKWKPGEQDGKPARVRMHLPIII